jgi:hypothetical protein
MSNRTFTMIKPDAFSKGHSGAIIDKILKSGFRIVALKGTRMSKEKAGEFYAVHKARPFYGELVDFMSSGPIIAAILEKDSSSAPPTPPRRTKAPFANYMRLLSAKMPSMAATATKMPGSRATSSSTPLKEYNPARVNVSDGRQ